MASDRFPTSFLIGLEGLGEILAFVTKHPEGVSLRSIATKFDLASEPTILAGITILKELNEIRVENDRVIYPVKT